MWQYKEGYNGSKCQVLAEIGHASCSEFFDWNHNYDFTST